MAFHTNFFRLSSSSSSTEKPPFSEGTLKNDPIYYYYYFLSSLPACSPWTYAADLDNKSRFANKRVQRGFLSPEKNLKVDEEDRINLQIIFPLVPIGVYLVSSRLFGPR